MRLVEIDTWPEMPRVAHEKLASLLSRRKLELYCGSLGDVALDVPFDRVLVTWFTFNYLIEDRERREFLSRALSILASGGLVAMDLFFPLSLPRPETENKWSDASFELDGRTLLLRQKRRMVADIEERIQIYSGRRRHRGDPHAAPLCEQGTRRFVAGGGGIHRCADNGRLRPLELVAPRTAIAETLPIGPL
jgi:hypothetical protein